MKENVHFFIDEHFFIHEIQFSIYKLLRIFYYLIKYYVMKIGRKLQFGFNAQFNS